MEPYGFDIEEPQACCSKAFGATWDRVHDTLEVCTILRPARSARPLES